VKRRSAARWREYEERLALVERKVQHLIDTVEEDRRLHRRVAELTDIVQQQLLGAPAASRGDDATPGAERGGS
jgi:hypothetical protein